MSILKRKPTIPYGKQEITQDDINAVVETLRGDFLTQGPKIKAFEDSSNWEFFLDEKKCKPDFIHNFGKNDFLHEKTVSHVRLNIYPDGGVSRFRIFGQPVS